MYQIFCVPDVKTSLTLSGTLSVILSISLSTTTEKSSKETFLKIWNSILNKNQNLIIQFNQFSQSLTSCLTSPFVNTLLYSDRFKSLIYIKTPLTSLTDVYQILPYVSSLLVVFVVSSFTDCLCKRLNLDLKIF